MMMRALCRAGKAVLLPVVPALMLGPGAETARADWRLTRFGVSSTQDATISQSAFNDSTCTQKADGSCDVSMVTHGSDIWNAFDSGGFCFETKGGPACQVLATVPSILREGENASVGTYAKAGVMIRTEAAGRAPMVYFHRETTASGSCRLRLTARRTYGGSVADLKTVAVTDDGAFRLRLIRIGDTFEAWRATNAAHTEWELFASVTLEGVFPDAVQAGFAACPQSSSAAITIAATDVRCEPLVTVTPDAAAGTVTVAWLEPPLQTEEVVTGYTLLRRRYGSDSWETVASGLTGQTYTDTTLDPAERYVWSVQASLRRRTGYQTHDTTTKVAGYSASDLQVSAVYRATVSCEDSANGVWRLRSSSAEWSSGILIEPPDGSEFIDLSAGYAFALDVENLSSTRQLRLTLHLSSGGGTPASDSYYDRTLAESRTIYTGIGLNPGETGTMRIVLPHPWIYLAPEGLPGRDVIDTAKVTKIEVKMQWPFEDEVSGLVNCRISNIRLEGTPNESDAVAEADYLPFIDEYGQFAHRIWPTKTLSDTQLTAAYAAEVTALQGPPAAWDEYGGWAEGPTLEATGHFRVEKVDDKWWFVTPSGHLFWSLGICVVRATSDAASGAAHPDWYETPVDSASPAMDFNTWNIAKRMGMEDFSDAYDTFVADRLDSWGINTFGNWCIGSVMLTGRKPYAVSITEANSSVVKVPNTSLYDVFDASFFTSMSNAVAARFASQPILAKSPADPMCIGYFLDNEPGFSALPALIFAASYSACAGKRTLLERALAKYGSVAGVAEAWGLSVTTEAQLRAVTNAPSTSAYSADWNEFVSEWYERYFRGCRDAIRAVSPDKLYLGCRFVGFRQSGLLWAAASKYCDVISVNSYANAYYNLPSAIASNCSPERPLLLSEFHFGTLDRGLFENGLCPVSTQSERARSFTRAVQGALCHPLLVGAHWFQYRDQPLIGRGGGGGEAYQIGFVDVADNPYEALCAAARDVGEHLYGYRTRGNLVNSMSGE